MKSKIILASLILMTTVMFSISPVLAHIHPLVPADECGLGDGAGNTSQPNNNDNANPPVPGLILGNVPAPIDKFFVGPGVAPATAHCTNN